MDLRKHFVKRYVFTILFLLLLFGFAAANFWHSKDALLETIKNAEWDFAHISENITDIEDAIGENVLGKMELIETYGFLQEVMGKKENNDFAFVKDENGMLYYSDFYNKIPECMEKNLKQAGEIAKLASQYGATTFAITFPDRYDDTWVEAESGLPLRNDTYITEAWKEGLKKEKIPVIDVRDAVKEAGFTGKKLFYNTDHHWRVEAAFTAYCDLVAQMNAMFDTKLDEDGYYRNLDNYNIYTYEQSYLGSMGREAGIIYSGLDDFTIIYPKFPTDYEREYYMGGDFYNLDGSFEETVFNSTYLNAEDIYANDKYSIYLDGVLIYDHIKNKNCPDGLKILWIRDSFTSPMAAFMSTSVSQMDLLWSINYEEDIEKLLAENEYDYVVIAIAGMNLSNDNLFPFMQEK